MESPRSVTLDDDFNKDANVIFSLNKQRASISSMKKDAAEKITASVQSVDPGAGRVVMIAPDVGLREFTFDGVFPQSTSQTNVYDTVARRLVIDFVNGYNATALAYGQTGTSIVSFSSLFQIVCHLKESNGPFVVVWHTLPLHTYHNHTMSIATAAFKPVGSGKTFSMFGLDESAIFTGGASSRGTVPRVCEEVLTAMKDRQQSFDIESEVGVSYVEVYGDQVSDLLKFGARCGQSKVASQRFVLQGAAERPIQSMEDVAEVLRTGAQQKRRAATAMNGK